MYVSDVVRINFLQVQHFINGCCILWLLSNVAIMFRQFILSGIIYLLHHHLYCLVAQVNIRMNQILFYVANALCHLTDLDFHRKYLFMVSNRKRYCKLMIKEMLNTNLSLVGENNLSLSEF